MNLNLTVLASASIKRKKPWPKIAWMGKDKGSLYLLDKHRVSQLYLPSGKTRKKVPSVQPFLIDVQILSTSSNGLYLCGALKSGKVFVWDCDSDSLHTTPVLDKIRNVLGLNNRRVSLFISNCGTKILLLSGLDQLFLWETEKTSCPLSPGEPFSGTWVQIQSGEYILPSGKDKETAIDGIFYDDPVHGQSAMVSWVFNKDDRIHITTLQFHWPQTTGNVAMKLTQDTEGVSRQYYNDSNSLPFTAKWHTFVHPLHGLTPAQRVLKSSKAYLGRFSGDGQVLAVAMNQKSAYHSRMMFYSTTSSAVAIVTDLKGCGATDRNHVPASGRLWWITDMCWTRDSLLLIAITRCGSLAILTKLGEPVLISTAECSVDMGPNYYLTLHPRISFRKPTSRESDSSLSSSIDGDALRQKFSVAVHPNLPVILTSDGYLVTVMQLPGNANYKGVISLLMTSISRLVPEIELDPHATPCLSSASSRVNLFQSESNLSRVQSNEEISEMNTLSSCSSSLAGYGLASGEQGFAFVPIASTQPFNPSVDSQEKSWRFVEAQNLSLQALALATSAGRYWSKDISTAMYFIIRGIVKLFSVLLRDHESLEGTLTSSLKMLSRPLKQLTSSRQPLDLQSKKLSDCFTYFKMSMELFQWDATNRNAFSLALRLIHGIIKEILGCKQLSEVLKISSSIQFLEFSEELLSTVYSWKLSSKSHCTKGHVTDSFSPTKVLAASSKTAEYQSNLEDHSQPSDELGTNRKQKSQVTTALSAPWLMLYTYTAQISKRSAKGRLDDGEVADGCGSQSTLTQILCDVQKKLQDIGVNIPTAAAPKSDHVSALTSFIERNQNEPIAVAGFSPMDSTSDSLFARRRANRETQEPKQSTPIRKTRSVDHLLGVSTIGKSPYQQHKPTIRTGLSITKDKSTETLLSILYLHLQQYNLVSAVELVLSLLEPPLEHLDGTLSAFFAPVINTFGMSRGQDYSTSQILSVLLQTFPIVRVADKRGVPVVQTLGRFMAAYFSNLPLYVFPAYHPQALPPFFQGGDHTRNDSTSDESFALSQGFEVIHLQRENVSAAVRDQGISDIWSANSALEFMLVSGLVGEASWLTNNLGDWKHALLLSVAHKSISEISHKDKLPVGLIQNTPDEITPEKFILMRLQPVFNSQVVSLSKIPKIAVDITEDATSTPTRDRLMREEPNLGAMELQTDEKQIKDVANILQAGAVAGIDIVPIITWKMLHDLLEIVSQMEWVVPEGLYLPAPPLFCPQPPSAETEFFLPRVYRERQLRSEVAVLVQKLLTLFHSSNCMAACMHWYVQELVKANEKWYSIPKDDQDFIVAPTLVAHSEVTTTFAAADQSVAKAVKRNSPKSKGKPSPRRSGTTPSPSVRVVLACFQQFCFVMWLLHARDKMSLCARKYRRARNEAENTTQTADLIESLCWETLQWTLELHPFSSFLGASAQVTDTLLTLLSEMPPSIATAEITARYFFDPKLIPTTSGRAKFKRLMAQFRGITLQEAGSIEEENSDEPLSILYRERCIQWEDELTERQHLFSQVQMEVFHRVDLEDELSNVTSASPFTTSKDLPCVGATIFETSQAYLNFLDTFFIITFTKTASQINVSTNSIPLLLPYQKLFTFSESKALRELQARASVEKRKKIVDVVGAALSRSQSYTDVRSSKPHRRDVLIPSGQTDIRRSNSMNDLSKPSTNSGIVILGNELIDLLPRLAWLCSWSSEGSFQPSSNIDKATVRGGIEGHPTMKVDVELPMLINSLWLLKNIYGPWELDDHVNPDFLRKVPKPAINRSLIEQECVASRQVPLPTSPGFSGGLKQHLLRRASSDTDIPHITVQSPTTEEDSYGKRKSRAVRAAACCSDTESVLPRPAAKDIKSFSQAKEKSPRKKSKPAKKSLKLDTKDDETPVDRRPEGERDFERTDTAVVPKSPKRHPKVKPKKAAVSPNAAQANQKMDEPITVDDNTIYDNRPEHIEPELALSESRESAMLLHNHSVITAEPTAAQGLEKEQSVERSRDVAIGINGSAQPINGGVERSRDVAIGINESAQPINEGVELLLVLRSNDDRKSSKTTNRTDVPLLKLSTMMTNTANIVSHENASDARAASKETGSQTEPTASASPSPQVEMPGETSVTYNGVTSTAVDFSAQYDESRDAGCQTAFSPLHSSQYNDRPSSPANQPQRALISRYDEHHEPPRLPWPERNRTQNANLPFPLLQLNTKPHTKDVPSVFRYSGHQQSETIKNESLPLLQIPKQTQQTNTRTFCLFEIPPSVRELPFLHMPKSMNNKQNKPDLSKIKFFEVNDKKDPLVLLNIVGDTKRSDACRQRLLQMPAKQSRVPVFQNIPIDVKRDSSMSLLQMPKEKSKPKLVPADELAAFEKKQRRNKDLPRYSAKDNENIKPKRSDKHRRKRRYDEHEPAPKKRDEDFRHTITRQRRRENIPADVRKPVQPKQIHVEPVDKRKPRKTKKRTEENKKPAVTLEGLSEESELDLSDMSENFDLSEEEQLYFGVQSAAKVTNPQVDEYCRELEAKVKKQFDKELESHMKQQVEQEVKERVEREMENRREEEEVRKRVREELDLQERLERQKREREQRLSALEQEEQTKVQLHLAEDPLAVSNRPVPRKRSSKVEKGTTVSFKDEIQHYRDEIHQHGVEVQVQNEEFVRASVDQNSQTNHTDTKTVPSAGPRAFAPALPPDIFIGLTYPCDDSNEGQGEYADTDGDPGIDTKKFISVVDLDSKLWETIHDSRETTKRHEENKDVLHESVAHSDQDYLVDAKDADVNTSPEHHSGYVQENGVQAGIESSPTGRQPQHDALTVGLMDSIDVPKQHIPDNARSISKQRISNRLEEMTEQLEAIEQISQNMDREFQSSNFLLNAIESIGDVMSPANHVSSRPVSTTRHERTVRDNAPWRRGKPAQRTRPVINDDQPATVLHDTDDVQDDVQVRFKVQGIKDTDETNEDDHEYPAQDSSLASETMKESDDDDGNDINTGGFEEEQTDVTPELLPARGGISRDMDSTGSRSVQTGSECKVRNVASPVASRRSNTESFKDFPKLSSEKLKQLLSDSHDSSKRDTQRSAEKRKKIQDWMSRKRVERHSEWKNQVDELRSTEHKPFTAAATEGQSSLKKIKLAEKERTTKRRNREVVHIDERMKEASNLLSEMLAEPIPKTDTLRNLRYAAPTPRNKPKHNERYGSSRVRTNKASEKKEDLPNEALVTRGPTYSGPTYSGPHKAGVDPLYGHRDADADQYRLGRREETRSVTPSGADFVTMKTYRIHEIDKTRRSQELEREIQFKQQQDNERRLEIETSNYRTGSSIDIDHLMDEIPDGSTVDDERLRDIDSLLSDDSELKELLSDVVGSKAKYSVKQGIVRSDTTRPLMRTVTIKDTKQVQTPVHQRKPADQARRWNEKPGTIKKPTTNKGQSTSGVNRTSRGRGQAGIGSKRHTSTSAFNDTRKSGLSRDRNADIARGMPGGSSVSKTPLVNIDDVSPWNTGDSLEMSDDVAQLLAEAKQAIGDDISESSGSIMSNIDWDAVDKIMNEM